MPKKKSNVSWGDFIYHFHTNETKISEELIKSNSMFIPSDVVINAYHTKDNKYEVDYRWANKIVVHELKQQPPLTKRFNQPFWAYEVVAVFVEEKEAISFVEGKYK